MLSRIIEAQPTLEYCLCLTFADGFQAEVDLREWIVGQGGVFAALEDLKSFQQVRVDPELGTVVWPNDVDFCPDVLRRKAERRQETPHPPQGEQDAAA